jgi:HIRAN domain
MSLACRRWWVRTIQWTDPMSRWSPRRRSSEPKLERAAPTLEGVTSRADPGDSAEVLQLPDDGRQRVVGEHFYQAALQRICRGQRVPRAGDPGCWANSLPAIARLVAEHDNPHDRTAVRVEVQGATVGHLPRDDAAVLHRYLAIVQGAGKHAECEGRIVIAGNGDYSIYLHLADLDSVAFALQLQSNDAPMDGPWQAEASHEEAHQKISDTSKSFGRFSGPKAT